MEWGFWLILLACVAASIITASKMEKLYDETLGIQYLLMDTILRMLLENYVLIIVGIAVFYILRSWLNTALKDKPCWKKIYSKVFCAGYFIVLPCIILCKPIHMNTYYELGGDSLNTAQVLYYHRKDAIEEEYLTFQAEPCEVVEGTVKYTLPRWDIRTVIIRKLLLICV